MQGNRAQSTEEQRVDVRQRVEVDPVHAGAASRHLQPPGNRSGRAERRHGCDRAGAAAQAKDHDHRPDQVELLLNRQAPRARQAAEVAAAEHDDVPDVASNSHAIPGREEPRPDHRADERHRGDARDERREQATRAAHVEPAQADPPRRGVLSSSTLVMRNPESVKNMVTPTVPPESIPRR